VREAFDGFAVPLEEIITTLETADPVRLPGRKKSFRSNVQQFLDIRAELNAAYHVTRAGIPFAFGREGGNAPSEPDFICELDGMSCHIEVTAKSPEGIGELHDLLETELIDSDVFITLSVSSILRISDVARRATVDQIVGAIAKMTDTTMTVWLPDAGVSAHLEKPSPFGSTYIVWTSDFGHDIGPTEEIFCEAVRAKSLQSVAGSWPGVTLLIVDASRLGHAVWLRPNGVWVGRLPELNIEWEALPFLGVAVVVSSLTTVGFRGAACARTNLDSTQFEIFNKLCQRLGLLTASTS
jgi:hypothetical protein